MRVCVFVETFEIFIYICAGRQLSSNLIPHLAERQPLAATLKRHAKYHTDFLITKNARPIIKPHNSKSCTY